MVQKKPINWKKIKNKIIRDRYMYLMLLPMMAFFIIFRYWLMGWLRMALYNYKLLKGLNGSKFVGLQHFQKFFKEIETLN